MCITWRALHGKHATRYLCWSVTTQTPAYHVRRVGASCSRTPSPTPSRSLQLVSHLTSRSIAFHLPPLPWHIWLSADSIPPTSLVRDLSGFPAPPPSLSPYSFQGTFSPLRPPLWPVRWHVAPLSRDSPPVHAGPSPTPACSWRPLIFVQCSDLIYYAKCSSSQNIVSSCVAVISFCCCVRCL